MSKSGIKTKTVLTMTDMTESTELLALKDKTMAIKLLLYSETNSKSGKVYLLTWCCSFLVAFALHFFAYLM